jgi:nifR3 family TIM-barrel protein
VKLQIGPFPLVVPVVLAPMAGITNRAFRRLCREEAERGLSSAGGRGAPDRGTAVAGPAASSREASAEGRAGAGPVGIFVSEMVTSRALLERNEESLRLVAHDPGERPRSVQLYGVDPGAVGAAVRMLVDEDLADHVDLNFGCPVPKVTRKGGGAALPWKLDVFGEIVARAVRAASPAGVPVTVKMRMGVDADHLTYLDAGRRAAAEGAAAVALHGRTAADYYSGTADWSAIARLREAVPEIPVLGNGDIWSAADALRMVARTGCDGVVVGRGCLGRPWLFADLAAGFTGGARRSCPRLHEVLAVMRRHLDLLIEHYATAGGRVEAGGRGEAGAGAEERARLAELRGCRDIRKHIAWYLKGYRVGHGVRLQLAHVASVAEFEQLVAVADADQPYPGDAAEGPRGRAGSPRRVSLPEGWLDRRELDSAEAADVLQAELSVSGG